MTNLQPCPNPECRSTTLVATYWYNGPEPLWHYVGCLRCHMRGPNVQAKRDSAISDNEARAEAIRLWDAIARTEPWIAIEPGGEVPRNCETVEVAVGNGVSEYMWGTAHGETGWIHMSEWDSVVVTVGGATHWRRITPRLAPPKKATP